MPPRPAPRNPSITARTPDSPADSDLEILGITTWNGPTVFIDANARPSVDDLVRDFIDLTVSPCPNTTGIVRPRGVARYASPSSRTAFSPTKHVPGKPTHPFFHQYQQQGRQSDVQQTKRGVAFSHRYAPPKYPGKPTTFRPVSPTPSTSSVESPTRPPPSSQRPRLAPPSSASSDASTASRDSLSSSSSSPSPSARHPRNRTHQSPTSPLRIILPPASKPPATTTRKTFTPSPTAQPPRPAAADKPPLDRTAWKWTKWGWTARTPVASGSETVRKHENKTEDTLVDSMQNLELASTGVEPMPPTPAPPAPAPPALPKFSHKTYHLSNPLLHRPPRIIYTSSAREANDLLAQIRGDAVAFDMEWPFGRGGSGKTALVQVGDERLVVLVHLSMMKEFPSKLRELLEDPGIYKLGVNVIGDGQKLVRDFGNIYTRGILDLSDIARAVDGANCKPGVSKIALAKLCARYIGCELEKGAVRTSNWSRTLSLAQRDYAADDVYSTTMIYNSLMYLAKARGITVDRAALAIDLSPEVYAAPAVILKDSTGATTNGSKPPGRTTVPIVKGISPSKMRALTLFNTGKSVLEIGQAMRTVENPLLPNTVRGYLLDVVTSDVVLEYDKQRMYDILSEDVHPANYQKNKAFLAKLVKQLGKQIARSPPPPPPKKNLVSSDVDSSQDANRV